MSHLPKIRSALLLPSRNQATTPPAWPLGAYKPIRGANRVNVYTFTSLATPAALIFPSAVLPNITFFCI